MSWQLVIEQVFAAVIESGMRQNLSQPEVRLRHIFVNTGHSRRKNLFADAGRAKELYATVDVETVV